MIMTTTLASRRAPGTTKRPSTPWCLRWWATLCARWPPSRVCRLRPGPEPTWWASSPWWPAKTSSLETRRGPGASPHGLHPTGWSRSSTPTRATPVQDGAQLPRPASRPTWPSNPIPASSPPATSPPATSATARPPSVCLKESPLTPRCWPTRPMARPTCAGPFRRASTRPSSSRCPLHYAIEGGFSIEQTSLSTQQWERSPAPKGSTVGITRTTNKAVFGAKWSGVSPAPAPHEGQERSQTGLFTSTTTCSMPRAERPSPRSSRPSIAGTDPWSQRSIAWLVAKGNRFRVAYRGIPRNQIWLAHRCAAINLRRLINLGLGFDGRGWGPWPTEGRPPLESPSNPPVRGSVHPSFLTGRR